jgi:hypothetical protein
MLCAASPSSPPDSWALARTEAMEQPTRDWRRTDGRGWGGRRTRFRGSGGWPERADVPSFLSHRMPHSRSRMSFVTSIANTDTPSSAASRPRRNAARVARRRSAAARSPAAGKPPRLHPRSQPHRSASRNRPMSIHPSPGSHPRSTHDAAGATCSRDVPSAPQAGKNTSRRTLESRWDVFIASAAGGSTMRGSGARRLLREKRDLRLL